MPTHHESLRLESTGRASAGRRRLVGVATTWMMLVIGGALGVGGACACPDVAMEIAPTYDIVTNLPDWEPDSGHVSVEGEELRIIYLDIDGAEWEIVYDLHFD